MRSEGGNLPSPSPDGRERTSPQNGCDSSCSPFDMRRASPENGHGSRHSPGSRGNSSPYHDYGGSPNYMPEPRDTPNYNASESSMHERNCSHSPFEEEWFES